MHTWDVLLTSDLVQCFLQTKNIHSSSSQTLPCTLLPISCQGQYISHYSCFGEQFQCLHYSGLYSIILHFCLLFIPSFSWIFFIHQLLVVLYISSMSPISLRTSLALSLFHLRSLEFLSNSFLSPSSILCSVLR